jgi:hypothetical protein
MCGPALTLAGRTRFSALDGAQAIGGRRGPSSGRNPLTLQGLWLSIHMRSSPSCRRAEVTGGRHPLGKLLSISCALVVCASAAVADMSLCALPAPADSALTIASASRLVQPGCVQPEVLDRVAIDLGLAGCLETGVSPAGICDSSAPASSSGDPRVNNITEIPTTPGGAALVISGLLMVGGARAGRMARGVHLVPIPDWYHDGAALQVRHAVVMDLNASFLPDRVFEQPVAERPVLRGRLEEAVACIPPQRCSLACEAPRGPPWIL